MASIFTVIWRSLKISSAFKGLCSKWQWYVMVFCTQGKEEKWQNGDHWGVGIWEPSGWCEMNGWMSEGIHVSEGSWTKRTTDWCIVGGVNHVTRMGLQHWGVCWPWGGQVGLQLQAGASCRLEEWMSLPPSRDNSRGLRGCLTGDDEGAVRWKVALSPSRAGRWYKKDTPSHFLFKKIAKGSQDQSKTWFP